MKQYYKIILNKIVAPIKTTLKKLFLTTWRFIRQIALNVKKLIQKEFAKVNGLYLVRQLSSHPRFDSLKHRVEAWKELLARYQMHFIHFWVNRHQISPPNLRHYESEFLPAALALQTKPLSPATKAISRILIGIIIFILLWSIFGKSDMIINASGKIIAASYTKSIAAVEIARVDQIYIQEGQSVHAGDPLIDLDTRMIESEKSKALSDKTMAQLQIARSRALLASIDANQLQSLAGVDNLESDRVQDARLHLQSQWHDFAAKRMRLDGEVSRYSQQLPFARQRTKDYQELAKNHYVSTHAYFEKAQEQIEIEGKLADASNQRKALIAEVRKSAQDALNEGLKLAGQADADVKRAVTHQDLLKITSPVDGVVQQLTVHTIGGVVPAAQTLMVIVPQEDQVQIEAFVENKDIGFIQEGQEVQVKIETFDYTKYGTIAGRVLQVSKDAIDPNNIAAMETLQNKDKQKKDQDKPKGALYSIKIELNQAVMIIDGKPVRLFPGMSATAEIKTGSRRIIEYFLSPLVQHTHESLNER